MTVPSIDRVFRGGDALHVTVADSATSTIPEGSEGTSVIVLEGAITARRRVEPELVSGWTWVVQHDVAGGFSVDFGPVGASVEIPVGARRSVYCDGATFVVVDSGSATPDAAATTKGVVQLAGDLAGTAAAPTVATVGGKTAAQVAAAVNQAGSAVQPNTSPTFTGMTISGGSPNAVVRADGSLGAVPSAALPAPVPGGAGGVALPASSVGRLYQDDGTWKAPGWSTLFDHDFTADATDALNRTDGGQNIGPGYGYVQNSANASVLQITSGTGLIIQPNATSTDFSGTARTGPNVAWKFLDLDPRLAVNDIDAIRIWFVFATFNQAANYDVCSCFVENFQSTTNQQRAEIVKYYDTATPNAVRWNFRRCLTTTDSSVFDATNTSHDVGCIVLDKGTLARLYTAPSLAGAPPAVSTLAHRASVSLDDNSSGILVPRITAASQWALGFAVAPVNTSGAFYAVLKRLRVDFRS